MSKTKTSLNEDTFFRNYGSYKGSESRNGGNGNGYHYDDHEDFSDED